jgi:hypothetical protein
MRPFSFLAVSALVIPLVATGLTANLSAAEGGLSIARWGGALLVTAPGGTAPTGAMAARLNQRITVDFKDASIDDVANFLRSVSGANLVIAPAVTASGTTVTLKATSMSLGNVLHWVTKMTDTHIGFIHGAIFLSDKPIEEASVTRLYDISDLTMPLKDFPGPDLALSSGDQGKGGGAVFMPPTESSNAAPTQDEIVEIIKKVVKPGQWKD